MQRIPPAESSLWFQMVGDALTAGQALPEWCTELMLSQVTSAPFALKNWGARHYSLMLRSLA